MTPDQLPSASSLAWPTLVAIRDAGEELGIKAISERVAGALGLTPVQCSILHGPRGHRTMLDYRLAWARSLLKGLGLLSNPGRGRWSVTLAAEGVTEADLRSRMSQATRQVAEVPPAGQP